MRESVTLLITGDFYGGGRIDSLIRNGNYEAVFNNLLSISQKVDIAITNLESPLTDSNKPMLKTGPNIKASPSVAKALKFAGFNLVTLANNHIMDYGPKGLQDTMNYLDKEGIEHCGAGMNLAEASSVFYKDIGGKRLAFINMTENEWSVTNGSQPGANPLNLVTNFYSIQEANQNSDFVFVIVHGGHEHYNLPSPRMKKTFRYFVDAGADTVISHHTHCYSGFEVYKEKPVFYSLGNFLFDLQGMINKPWNRGLVIKFTLNSKLGFEIIPINQCNEIPGVNLIDEKEKQTLIYDINKLNQIILDDSFLEYEFKKYCDTVKELYSSYLEPHSFRILHNLRKWRVIPSFLNTRKKLLLKNLISCEAHRDVVTEILKG